jgi:Ca2+-binding RTX toxin-like protein
MYGGDGADRMWGGTNDDVLFGDGGNDVLHGDARTASEYYVDLGLTPGEPISSMGAPGTIF